MRAQGWAEAEKAKAQRKPAAMREHEQIFGQAPTGIAYSWERQLRSRIRRSHEAYVDGASARDAVEGRC